MATIHIKQWLDANKRTRVAPTDKWYLDFAARILPLIKQSPLFQNEETVSSTDAAISLSIYFQDAIAQNGGWRSFAEAYYEQYGHYLPFYTLTDTYIPDEINIEDIAFIIWSLKSRPDINGDQTYTIFNPLDEDLMALSQSIYKEMDISFEEAPICKKGSPSNWLIDSDLLKEPSMPLPEVNPESTLSKDAAHCLEYSKGKPLLYFSTYTELRDFFIKVLQWENHPHSLLSDLKTEKDFVIYANAKGMLIAHNVAAYFQEKHNPVYDARRAASEGYQMFCKPGRCPFDLLKYGMEKNILSEAALPFAKGKELLHQNWDFIARYYLGEYYEGE